MPSSDTPPAVLNVPEIQYPTGARQRNRVAFYWNPTQTRGLYVHDCDTAVTQKITSARLRTRPFPEDFLWGADGQRLYYICTQGEGDFDGPFDLRQTTLETDTDATTIFSADSFFVLEDTHPTRDELLISYRRGRSQLYRLTPSTGDCEQVSDHLLIRRAHYSADGDWIAINTAYAEDAPNEQRHLAITDAAGHPHIDGLDSGPVEFVSWHPSKPQLLIAAADEREQFGLYDVPTDDVRWLQTDVPQTQPIDFLPSGERILTLCDGTPQLYPIEENATAVNILGKQPTAIDAATVTADSLVFQQHDDNNNAILTQYTIATDTETTVLTSEPGPGAAYRSLITDVAKDLARTPRIDDDNRMAVSSVHSAEREALSPLLTNGFEIIGTGLGRLVLRFPETSAVADSVLKLARFGDTPLYAGAIQNQWEVAVWEACANAAEVPLLPILNYQSLSHRWLVVPYGEPITDESLQQQLAIVEHVQTEMPDIPKLNAFDIHRNNIVRYDDEYYLADYGRPPMH